MERLLTLTETRDILGIDPHDLYELLAIGAMPFVLIKVHDDAQGDPRVDPQDLREFIKGEKVKGMGQCLRDGGAFPNDPLYKRTDEAAAKTPQGPSPWQS